MERGAYLNLIQSTSYPVRISHTLTDLSKEEQITYFESGYEKQTSVILFSAASLNSLTFRIPDLTFMIDKLISAVVIAIKSLSLL